MSQTIQHSQRDAINALMRLFGVFSFQGLEDKLDLPQGTVSRTFHGKVRISSRTFLRAAILLDMKPSELLEKTGIPKDYFFEGA